MSQRQRALGVIDEINLGVSDDAISELLETIIQVKTVSNLWLGKLEGLGKSW
jgi:hypothetical protein